MIGDTTHDDGQPSEGCPDRDDAAVGDAGLYAHGSTDATRRLPAWLRRPLARPGAHHEVEAVLGELKLHTVCQSAKCPNRSECFGSGTATFLIMGDACTRGCRFCAVDTRPPSPLDSDEPRRVAQAAKRLALRHIVVTTVTRDDLPDGGASHFVDVIRAVRAEVPDAAIEVLTSDFAGDLEAVDTVARALPDVFNHNLETVPSRYEAVRPGADYARSLSVLERVSVKHPAIPTKSGLMLGLGENPDEVRDVMRDLRSAGVRILTLGQYLRPGPDHLPVTEFVEPSVFAALSRDAYRLGFSAVASAPFVRSSYHAGELRLDADG